MICAVPARPGPFPLNRAGPPLSRRRPRRGQKCRRAGAPQARVSRGAGRAVDSQMILSPPAGREFFHARARAPPAPPRRRVRLRGRVRPPKAAGRAVLRIWEPLIQNTMDSLNPTVRWAPHDQASAQRACRRAGRGGGGRRRAGRAGTRGARRGRRMGAIPRRAGRQAWRAARNVAAAGGIRVSGSWGVTAAQAGRRAP